MLLVDHAARWVVEKLDELGDNVVVKDYIVGLSYSYVIVEGAVGKAAGAALTPIEDLMGVKTCSPNPPEPSRIEEMVSSLNPLEKALGIALLNALSSYLLFNHKFKGDTIVVENKIVEALMKNIEEPVLVIGNLRSLVNRLRESGIKKIWVVERNPSLRCREALSDAAATRLLRKTKTVYATGATLVNDTIDYILRIKRDDTKLILVGPTAGAHPHPILKAGVHMIASIRITKCDEALKAMARGGGRRELRLYSKDYVAHKAHDYAP